jgi:cytochrome c-type biogenesis protein CcmF
VKTVLGNRRHYGGMIVHFGIVIIALGLVGSGLFRSEAAINMAPGDVVEIAGERLRFEGVAPLRGPNYDAMQASLTLLDSGRVVRPERRQYLRQEMPMTETGIDSTMLRDVYVALGDATGDDRWAVHVYVNPLVRFIWTGGLIILSGLFLSLTGRRRNNKISVTTDEHR